jgi:hypothetical protein
MDEIELRYLSINWGSKGSVEKFSASSEVIAVEKLDGEYFAETTTFPELFCHIGICFKQANLNTPILLYPDDKREELIKLKAPGTSDEWWVTAPVKKDGKYYTRPYYTAGRLEILTDVGKLNIENSTFNFSVVELEHYLNDFKDGMWGLIFDSNSPLRGASESSIGSINREFIDLLQVTAANIEKLAAQPSKLLVETRQKLPVKSVRPVPTTFRERVTKPTAKLLTSRAFEESFDTLENRYIHHCVRYLVFLIKGMGRLVDSQLSKLEQRLESEESYLKDNADRRSKLVDPLVLESELVKLRSDLEVETRLLERLSARFECQSAHPSWVRARFELGKSYGSSSTVHFAANLKVTGLSIASEPVRYYVVEFPAPLSSDEVKLLWGRAVECVIDGRWTTDTNNSGDKFGRLTISGIGRIRYTSAGDRTANQIRRLERFKADLERMDWQRALEPEEQAELKRELEVSRKTTHRLRKRKSVFEEFQHSLSPLLTRFLSLQSFFVNNGVRHRAECPNTMVFVQNPFYAGAKAGYRKVLEANDIDERSLSALMAIEDMGLLETWLLYERWCLVKLFNVLIDIYKFIPPENWQSLLVDLVLRKKKDVSILLFHPYREQELEVTYEKELESKRRPDFVLDLFEVERTVFSQKKERRRIGRLVLDAKFKGNLHHHEVNEIVRELVEDKDYSEGGNNAVFILHPIPEVVEERTSPLDWGRSCDYGQIVEHKKGSIFLSPSLKYPHSIDNLHRLIGQFLQVNHKIEENDEHQIKWHSVSCIACGASGSDFVNVRYDPTKRGGTAWRILCNECHTISTETYCFNCHTPLFKNGPKWTYHRTRVEQTSNVVCPLCEEFL